jgi:four helix bundle protein
MESVIPKPARSFKDLRVWQESYTLTILVYKLIKGFPVEEKYGLSSQMTRAAISVSSNIAEGFGRRHVKEKNQFYSMANGSLTELENQLLVSEGVGYISHKFFEEIYGHCEIVHRMLINLQKANHRIQY